MSEATDIIDGHLDADFTRESTRGPTSVSDSSLPSYDPEATATVLQRSLEFLDRIG